MVRTALEVLKDIDVIVFVTEPRCPVDADKTVINSLKYCKRPVLLVINKTDTARKAEILPVIETYRNMFDFSEIIPVSAKKNKGIDILLENILKYIPYGPRYFPDELVTDQYERFMAAEIIREKIIHRTSDEIPYSVAVEVTGWTEREDGLLFINADIYVEREGQKGIIIGEKGKRLKNISTASRLEIERMLRTKIFLALWVKVRKGWRDSEKALHELGYH